MKIVPAQPDEFNVIQYIVQKTWPVAYGKILSTEQLTYMIDLLYSLEKLNQDVANGQHYYLIEDEKQEPVGFMGIQHQMDGKSRLHKIYVLPQYQGKGVGKLLIEKAESLSKEAHSSALLLNVNRFNKARYFYEKLGFSILREEDVPIGNGYLMQDFAMEKPI